MTVFFFFNDTATTEIYTLSLHDALPIWSAVEEAWIEHDGPATSLRPDDRPVVPRSEEHTSELQSQSNLVCRLLLEKKKTSASAISRLMINSNLVACWTSRSALSSHVLKM